MSDTGPAAARTTESRREGAPAAPEGASAEARAPRSGWWDLLFAGASVLGAALVLWRETTYGAGLTGRAVHLLSAARNYWEDFGFVGFATPEVPLGPPLYPLLLTLLSPGWIDPLEVAGLLNAALFAGAVFLVGRYLNRRLHSGFLRVWAPFALAAAFPLVEMSYFALPGPLFLLLAALAMIRTEEYLAEGKPASLVGAALAAALACQTRYLGAALLVGVVVLVSLLDRRASLRRRAFLGGVSVAALLPWAFALPGSAAPAWFSRLEGPGGFLRILGSWADPNFLPFAPGRWEVYVLAAMVAAAFVTSWRVRRKTGGSGRSAAPSRALPVFGGFALTYAAVASLGFRFGVARDAAEEGLLGPLYLALLLVAAVGLDRFLRAEPIYEEERPPGTPPATGIAAALDRFDALSGPALTVMAVLTLWVAGQAVPHAREIERRNAEEPDIRAGPFASGQWQSEILRYLRDTPTPLRIYSNRPALVYLHTSGGRGFSPLPKRNDFDEAADGHLTPEALSGWFRDASEGAWVIWFPFAENNRGYGYGPPLLSRTPGLEVLVAQPAGFIYEVNPSHTPEDDGYYRTAYEAARAGAFGDPIARAAFDLYSDGESLYFLRESCATAEVAEPFRLRLTRRPPEEASDEEALEPVEDRDFLFADYGAVVDGACIAVAPGPLHDLEEVVTGQGALAAGGPWSVTVAPDALKRRVYEPIYERIGSGAVGEARAVSEYDLYLDGTELLYLKEPCSPEDTEHRFALHFYADASDLPEERRQYGFENRDFWFADHGWRFDDRCVARVTLPPYPISRIATGQYIIGGDGLWRAEVQPAE